MPSLAGFGLRRWARLSTRRQQLQNPYGLASRSADPVPAGPIATRLKALPERLPNLPGDGQVPNPYPRAMTGGYPPLYEVCCPLFSSVAGMVLLPNAVASAKPCPCTTRRLICPVELRASASHASPTVSGLFRMQRLESQQHYRAGGPADRCESPGTSPILPGASLPG